MSDHDEGKSAMKVAHVLAVAVTALCLGLVIGSGDALVVVTMFVGCAAAGLAGWWLRDWEADQHERDRGQVARSIERRSATTTVGSAPSAVAFSHARDERHPFVTRPDGDPETPTPTRDSPRR